jgi:hypothetical protein
MSVDVRLIAFYLPQFHPIPENDQWWGPGFTEWTNVTRARAMYEGHYQPRRPGELGYYDLRVPEVRHRQVELARKYGIHGFCYYYYWFSGRRLLERPLDLMLADTSVDFPFCVCWANENWSRRWDGSEQELLIEQQHLPDDPERFIEDLAPLLRDSRYIRVNGVPLVLVYRPAIIPHLRDVVRRWRSKAEAVGVGPLHVCAVQSFGYTSGIEDGFDAMVEFPPHSVPVGEITESVTERSPEFKGKLYSYPDVVKYCVQLGAGVGLPVYRGVMTAWDNTPRRGVSSHIFHEATPEHYEVWLRRILDYTRSHHSGDQRLVFINAWNEWAEGAYLEPDEKNQYRYLEATARAIFGVPDPFGLLRTLRQINEGHGEAQRLLDQLEHALEVNGRIIDLVNVSALSSPSLSRDGATTRFHPLGRTSVVVPQHVHADGVVSFLDALNTPHYQKGVTLNRGYDFLLLGWMATRRVPVGPNSPIIFKLTNLDSGAEYFAQVQSRERRDDVVAHLKAATRGFRAIPESCALHSGYRAYLNIAAVEPGAYKLEAIVPTADRQHGFMTLLHSSLTIQ